MLRLTGASLHLQAQEGALGDAFRALEEARRASLDLVASRA